MNTRNGNRRRLLSSEERVLWRIVTQSIAPLRPDAEDLLEESEPVSTPPAPPRPPPRPMKTAAAPAVTPKPVPPPLTPLGRRMKQKVARGQQAIDARLDLHGLTQSEAHAALLHFLRTANARDARLVLVITGKGRSEGERGVLRRQVPLWLGLPEFRALVVGFENAHIAHGGEGALYVRVRRARG